MDMFETSLIQGEGVAGATTLELQKSILLEGIMRRLPDTSQLHVTVRALFGVACFGSTLPADFGLWCLDRAVELEGMHSAEHRNTCSG